MIWCVVPLWNRGNDITKLLFNLNRVKNLKVIICDFHSTDISWVFLRTLDIHVKLITIEGPFNIAIGVERGVRDDEIAPGDIVVLLDADTVFDDPIGAFNTIDDLPKDSFFAPIVGTEAQPTQWKAEFNGTCWVPIGDPRGFGFAAIEKYNYLMSRGFEDHPNINKFRLWGGHDTYLCDRFKAIGLKCLRPTLGTIWLRKNRREGSWYSVSGGRAWYV